MICSATSGNQHIWTKLCRHFSSTCRMLGEFCCCCFFLVYVVCVRYAHCSSASTWLYSVGCCEMNCKFVCSLHLLLLLLHSWVHISQDFIAATKARERFSNELSLKVVEVCINSMCSWLTLWSRVYAMLIEIILVLHVICLKVLLLLFFVTLLWRQILQIRVIVVQQKFASLTDTRLLPKLATVKA